MSATSFCSGSRSITGYSRRRVELGGVGPGHAGHVAGELDHRHLQAQAQAEIGHLVLAGVAHGHDLALDAPHAEAARAPGCRRPLPAASVISSCLQRLGVHPDDLQVRAVVDGRVLQRLDHAQVGVLQLARTCPPARCAPCPSPTCSLLDQGRSTRPVASGPVSRPSLSTTRPSRPSSLQVERHVVDMRGIHAADDGPRLHVGEEGDLLLEVLS